MKASVISSLIVALAGVLVTASPMPAGDTNCRKACEAQCASQGKGIFGSFECDGGAIVTCGCKSPDPSR
ncbi:hypothetical protein LX36DRAFT_710218 [Colletotrichum falcatum]|nr:hypothetical protein LX36DRAFT_710218 [Colletotrichum falcatum]